MDSGFDGGLDLKKLLQMVIPVVGGIAGDPAQQTGFQQGWQHGQSMAQQERERKQALALHQRDAGSRYTMDVFDKLNAIDNPDEFVQLRDLAAKHAPAGVNPGELAAMQFPQEKLETKKRKAIADQLDALERGGYNLDDLSQAGTRIELKDGTSLPIDAAIDLTRKRPIGLDGQPVPKPKRADVAASTDYGRFLARYAKDKGKTVDTLTAADELDARKTFNTVDDKPANGPAPASVDAQFNDLVALWKDGHQGQDPPAVVRTQLRMQAKKQIGTADDRPRDPNGRSASGLLPAQEFAMSEKLAKAWTETNKAQREMQRQFSLMQTGLKRFRQGDKNGGSQGVLVTFQKILDPSSVVRESEYARSSAGISALRRIEGYTERLQQGGAGVPDAELSAMVETARQFVQDMHGFTSGQRKRIESQAKKYGIDAALVFDDVAAGGSAPAESPAPAAPGAPLKVGAFTVVVK